MKYNDEDDDDTEADDADSYRHIYLQDSGGSRR